MTKMKLTPFDPIVWVKWRPMRQQLGVISRMVTWLNARNRRIIELELRLAELEKQKSLGIL